MKIVFTLCSINYLAQAHTLGYSLKKTNPDYYFYIGLVDILHGSGIDAEKLPPFPIVELQSLGISFLDEMTQRYNITELNTAVKPFYIKHFYETFPQAEQVLYFDPDIEIFQPLTPIKNLLLTHDIILTPHITTPVDALAPFPNERSHLNTGLYNLGFLATKRSTTTQELIAWWQERLRYFCSIDLLNGMFVDQLWLNFAPIFYPKEVAISYHLGLNVAYWNLQERVVTFQQSNWYVNHKYLLVFFHYSGYDIENPERLFKYGEGAFLNNYPTLVPLFNTYREQLLQHNHNYFKQFPCAYLHPRQEIILPKIPFLKNILLKILGRLIFIVEHGRLPYYKG